MPESSKKPTSNPFVFDKVTDIPWFKDVLARSKDILASTPDHMKPSWYREHEAEQAEAAEAKKQEKADAPLTKQEAREVFNLLMNSAENGLDWALVQSGFAEGLTNKKLAKLVKKHAKARADVLAALQEMSEDKKVLAVAKNKGTDMYEVADEIEYRHGISTLGD